MHQTLYWIHFISRNKNLKSLHINRNKMLQTMAPMVNFRKACNFCTVFLTQTKRELDAGIEHYVSCFVQFSHAISFSKKNQKEKKVKILKSILIQHTH